MKKLTKKNLEELAKTMPVIPEKDYAEKIRNVFSDKENYIKLRRSSRNEFETRLNWDIWGKRVNKILEDAVAEWRGS